MMRSIQGFHRIENMNVINYKGRYMKKTMLLLATLVASSVTEAYDYSYSPAPRSPSPYTQYQERDDRERDRARLEAIERRQSQQSLEKWNSRPAPIDSFNSGSLIGY